MRAAYAFLVVSERAEEALRSRYAKSSDPLSRRCSSLALGG